MKNYAIVSLLRLARNPIVLLAALYANAEEYWQSPFILCYYKKTGTATFEFGPVARPQPQRRQRGREPADDLEYERECGLE